MARERWFEKRCRVLQSNTLKSQSPPVAMAPAAYVQERLWVLHQCLPKAGIYNIPTALKLTGHLEVAALRSAMNTLVERHESLRTRFAMHEGRLMQLIYPPEPMAFKVVEKQEIALSPEEMLREEGRYAFDLTRESPIRAALFRTSEVEHVLLVVAHHLVSDEWSVRVMLSELRTAYRHYAASPGTRGTAGLSPLELQYADYAAWQNEWLESSASREQLQFWSKNLEGYAEPVDFPFDRPRPAEANFEGARERVTLSAELSENVFVLARRFKTTPFNVLFAAFQALQARYTQSDRVLTGTVVGGRNRTETEPLIGFFVNLLAIPTTIPETMTFEGLIGEVKERTVAAYANQDLPFDRVVAQVNPERSGSRMPLTEVIFTIQNAILEDEHWGEVKVEWLEVYNGTAKFDLNITVEQSGERFSILAEYRTALFDRTTIQRLCGHYARLLEQFAENPEQAVWKAEILTREEKKQLITEWNDTAVELPEPVTIHGLFEEQAQRSPEAVALHFEGGQWTYRELNDRAERLAAALVSRGGDQGAKVGVFLQRGPELIQTLVAVLKCGGCYVPLDTEYPAERLKYLVEDAGVQLLVTDRNLLTKLPSTGAKVLLLEEALASPEASASRRNKGSQPESAAYMMYTSGSTGQPKGVVVSHRNVVRLVKNATYMSFDASEVFLQYAPVAFDAATLEIWGPLLNGGRLAIMPPQQASLEELSSALKQFKVTTLWLTSGLFNIAVDEQIQCFRGLKQMLTGGDIGSPRHFRRFLEHYPGCRLFNAYGPTENTTFTTVVEVTLEDLRNSNNVPIGRPVTNTTVYILDRFMQPVPVGVTGELYTGGKGVALGYYNALELTAAKFVADPFEPGGRLYRTGDLARWLPNGVIQFIGRRDQQVKIRGFRVEPGEIEEAMRSCPAVREAVVIVCEPVPQQKSLVAYWTAHSGKITPGANEFRELLKPKLPGHMIPGHFVQMESLPLDANGKVNRKALPSPPPASRDSETEAPAQCSALEEQLLKLWREVFRDEKIGLHDDFFEIGGQSLLATQVVSRIRQSLKVELPLGALFDYATVADLASYIETKRGSSRGEL